MTEKPQTLSLPQRQNPPSAAQIELPAPTSWPIVFAFGVALVFGGMVTSASVSILGAILFVAGTVGWFRQVLPHEAHETLPITEEVAPVFTKHPEVERVSWLTHEEHRAHLPIAIYPLSAGVKGGLAGSIAMAFFAILYGVISGHGIWYPINLLAAGFFPEAVRATTAQLAAFNLSALLIAVAIHLTTSLVVGLLYGATLPMIPRRPVFLGGLVAPIVWTGLLHTTLGIINPVLNQRISWPWFVVSQVGFGIVAGLVVLRQEKVLTWQNLPFAARAGVEALGMPGKRQETTNRD